MTRVASTFCDVSLLCLLGCAWALITSGVVAMEERDELYQRARFYLNKLDETLKELEADGSGSNPSIHKRAASSASSQLCDHMIKSLQRTCYGNGSDFGGREEGEGAPTSSAFTITMNPAAINAPLPLYGATGSESAVGNCPLSNDRSTLPDVFLTKAVARRTAEGESIEVQLYLNHSSGVIIKLFNSFDNQIKVLPAPTEHLQSGTDKSPAPETETETETRNQTGNKGVRVHKFKTSRVTLTLDASFCKDNNDQMVQRVYIAPVGNRYQYSIGEVDICKFDQTFNETLNWGMGGWVKAVGGGEWKSQVLQIPRLKVLSQYNANSATAEPTARPANTETDMILIERGKPVSVDVEVCLDRKMEFTVTAQLWDWAYNASRFDTSDVRVKRGRMTKERTTKTIDIVNHYPNDERLLEVSVLKEKVLKRGGDDGKLTTIIDDDGDDDDDDDDIVINARLRITVYVESGDVSGMLILSNLQGTTNWRYRQTFNELSNGRIIRLQLPYKLWTQPLNTVNTWIANSVICDKNGNRDSEKYGRNCTVECSAWGSSIQSIVIIKTYPYRAPIKSTLSAMSDTYAHVIQDLGPASSDNNGTYRCTVVFRNGKTKTKEFLLRTYPNVEYSFEDYLDKPSV